MGFQNAVNSMLGSVGQTAIAMKVGQEHAADQLSNAQIKSAEATADLAKEQVSEIAAQNEYEQFDNANQLLEEKFNKTSEDLIDLQQKSMTDTRSNKELQAVSKRTRDSSGKFQHNQEWDKAQESLRIRSDRDAAQKALNELGDKIMEKQNLSARVQEAQARVAASQKVRDVASGELSKMQKKADMWKVGGKK